MYMLSLLADIYCNSKIRKLELYIFLSENLFLFTKNAYCNDLIRNPFPKKDYYNESI
jgi:hypothetical protein